MSLALRVQDRGGISVVHSELTGDESTRDPNPGPSAGRRAGHYFLLANRRLPTEQVQLMGARDKGLATGLGEGKRPASGQDTTIPPC